MMPIAPRHSNPARLALCGRATHSCSVDGARWPKSTDLRTELPDFVAILSLSIGAVNQVVYDPATQRRPTLFSWRYSDRLLRAVSTATQPMSVDTLRQLATYFAASDHPAMP